MIYWATAAKFAWRETKLFTPIKALPPFLAAVYRAWHEGVSTMSQWAGISGVLFVVYSLLAVIEFLYKMFLVAPVKLYGEVKADKERLGKELKELLSPKLEILFEPRYPYDDQRSPGPTQGELYRLFRIGVRNIGIKTVTALKVQISDVKPPREVIHSLASAGYARQARPENDRTSTRTRAVVLRCCRSTSNRCNIYRACRTGH